MILNMTSTALSRLEMTDYADRSLVERISTVPRRRASAYLRRAELRDAHSGWTPTPWPAAG
jgi:hypothetical protein